MAVAVVGPLHELAEQLLWAHMVQHEMLMVIAAPLLALGRPVEAWAWALGRGSAGVVRALRPFSEARLAWSLHAIAIWLWHLPLAFGAALANPALHFLQHASFFATAALFWWSIVNAQRQLPALVSLFTTMLHTGALGALMALSPVPWYPGYDLEDQQLAGLVMWIPAGLAYPAAALWILFGWFSRRHGDGPRANAGIL